jgi:hypothetical protein
MAEAAHGWVTVATYGAVYQAEIAAALLESAGIPAQIRGERTGIFGPGWAGMAIGGVEVRVPAPDLDEAREVLAGGEPAGEEEEEAEVYDFLDEEYEEDDYEEDDDEEEDEPWRG